jgi:2-aminoadipate transaminase
LITTGSQQGLYLLGKVLIDEGSKVLVETPSYLGALQAFSLFAPKFASLPSDEQGIVTDGLDAEQLAGARFLYCLPNFQNPTGRRMPLERRKALVALASAAGVPLVEDDPYGELSYGGEALPSLLSMNPDGVIYMGSFSKVLAPGLRLGYIAASRQLIDKLVQAKQATDLHTSTLTQMAAYEVIKDGFLTQHLPTVRELYRRQCGYMLDALKREFPSAATWTQPEGGMFIWVTLPEGIDTSLLLKQAIQERVAFVPGLPFYANTPAPLNTMRLSFVTVPEEKIRSGVATLARLIKAQLA